MTKTKMMASIGLALSAFLLCCSIDVTQAQENAQLQIPPSLVECYNTSLYMNRDNRLPSTVETLITLIEKVENSYLFSQSIGTLATSLIHRFRQDGIQKAQNVVASPGVLPYSPIGFQFPKFRILLSRLIPGNAINFPNDTLTREERCTLHFMLSSSFDTRIRGDENQVCTQLSQYRTQRYKRFSDSAPFASNFQGDVEILDEIRSKAKQVMPKSGRQSIMWNGIDYGTTNINDISQCPVENGVMWTPWGTVAAGTVIAGIAAGLAPQTVQLRTLLALSSRPGVMNAPQQATVSVDNRWAATLAGDLAEVALVQVPMSSTESASVGATGAWNSTVLPKWYFLTQRQNLEMTDAEIRGGLDGLIIAMNVSNWQTQAGTLKLSQLLRMYYSSGGVLTSGIKACDRKINFPNVAPINTLIAQTSAFAQVLDREMSLKVTLSPSAIANFSSSASTTLQSYVPGYLNDPSCVVNNGNNPDVTSIITPMTNIYVYLDTSWPFNTVRDYLFYVLNGLNINPYASQVTLLAASNGSIIVNTTNYLSDVEQGWNITTNGLYIPGFNLPSVLRSVQNLTQNYMNAQQANSSVGGLSMVALIMPYTANVNDGDSSYSQTQLKYIYEQVPDLHFIYYTGGTVNRFSSYVRDPSQDLFSLSLSQRPQPNAQPVLTRIMKIPRRIINPLCGSSWYSSTWGSYSMNQYVNPGYTNFYRVVPNYFFPTGSNRQVSISSTSSSPFTVCTSRYTVLPIQSNSSYSSTGSDVTCQQIQGSSFSYDLSSACKGYYTISQCPPLYLSVAAINASSSSSSSSSYQTVSCSNAACQTPSQQTFTVTVLNLDCNSSAASLLANFAIILFAFLLLKIFK